MRVIVTPDEEPKLVYETCVNSIADVNLRNRLNEITNLICLAAEDYKQKGTTKKLHTIPPNESANNKITLGAVTKQELKDIYSTHMVKSGKPARLIYDQLLSRASHNICPLCGIGQASTLDHYLPKSKYPQLSVLPLNLVPSCKDCNTGKNNTVATSAEAQNLHPYFDHNHFINEQWLFAKVISSSPEIIDYFVYAPKYWDDISKKRVHSHFNDFKLAGRFSVEAANELANRKYFFDEVKRKNGIHVLADLLWDEFRSRYKNHVNSWQTAFYQALLNYNQEQDKNTKDSREICPLCEGEGQFGKKMFFGYFCPLCEGCRDISKDLISKTYDLDIDYLNLPCPNCKSRATCCYCLGKGFISREKARQLNRL